MGKIATESGARADEQMKKNILVKARTDVPLYACHLWCVVAHDARKALRDMDTVFTNQPDDYSPFTALAVRQDHKFGLFFHPDDITTAVVGHEIMHATHRIMDWIGCDLANDSSEPFAFLNGWIHGWVYTQLKKARIRVSP